MGLNWPVPELPEVEALAQELSTSLGGQRVVSCHLISFSALKTFAPPIGELEGSRLVACRRFGKQLGLDFGALWLVIRFARGGWVRMRPEPAAAGGRRGDVALRLSFSGSDPESPEVAVEVSEAGTEKRLGLWVVRRPTEVPSVAALGPDPLSSEFTLSRLESVLDASNSTLKSALTDQSRIGGIGNAYSDEILHRARLSPFRLTRSLDSRERLDLHHAIVDVLEKATRAAIAASPRPTRHRREGLRVHGRAGERCPVCQDVIRLVSYAERSLFYCPTCQTGGRLLADRRMSRLLR